MANELVSFYRQQFPDDTRPDDEITLQYAQDHPPEALSQFPQFSADLQRIVSSQQKFIAADYLQQAVRSGITGLAAPVASGAESLAIAARGLNRLFPLGPDVPLQEMPTYRAAQAIRSGAEAISPEPVPGLEKSFLATTLPEAAGSTLGFIAGGAAAKALEIPGALGIAGLGAMTQASQGYEEAIKAGALEKDAFHSYLLNAGVGATVAVPLAGMLERLDTWSGGTLKKAIVKGASESIGLALQNAFQGYAGNKIANTIVGYDKARKDYENLLTEAEAGGVVGLTLSLLSSAVGAKIERMRKAGEKVPDIPVIPPPTEERPVAPVITPPVEIPNQDVVENYTGPLPEERKAFLQRIAEEKIRSGVDLSAGLSQEDQTAVRVIEAVLQKGGETSAEIQKQEADRISLERQGEPAVSEPEIEAQARVAQPEGAGAELVPPEPEAVKPPTAVTPGVPAVPTPEAAVKPPEPVSQAPAVVERAPAPPPTAVAIPPTKVDLLSEIGFENAVFKAQPSETTVIGTKGGEARVVQPAYHERFASSDYSPELGKQLTQNASPEGGLGKQNTRRITAFENSETGQVVALGTYELPGKGTYVVDPASKKGQGTRLEEFLKQKEPNGEQLWNPYASMWIPGARKAFAQTYDDARAFESEVGRPAKERIASLAKGAESSAAAMQAAGFTAEGERLEKATEASYTPTDSAGEFRDVIVEWIPKDTAGQIRSDLTANDVQESLLSAFEQKDNADVLNYALREGLAEIKENPELYDRFLKLSRTEQQRAIIRAITELVYAKYKEGFYRSGSEQARLGGGVVEGTRPAAVPEGGNKELQRLAEVAPAGANVPGAVSAETAASQGQAATEVRYSKSEPSPYRNTGAKIADDFGHVLNGLALQGIEARLVRDAVSGIVGEYRSLPNGERIVTLAVSDIENPTRDNLIASLHEAFHALFAQESPEMQRAGERAIEGLRLERFTPELAPGVDPARVGAEERLAEAISRRLGAAGLPDAPALATRIIALLREIYLKVALRLQQVLFGNEHTRQELALAYFQSRLTRFVAGDNLQAGFLAQLGGGRPTRSTQSSFFRSAQGGGWVPEFFNWETGKLEYPQALEMSVEAVAYNASIRYSKPEYVNDPMTRATNQEEAAPKIAGHNAFKNLLQEMYRTWTARGHNTAKLSYDEMLADGNFVRLERTPDDWIQAQNQHLVDNGTPAVNPATQVSDLPSESMQKRASTQGVMYAQRLRTDTGNRRMEAERDIRLDPMRLTKSITRVLDVQSRYMSDRFTLTNVREQIKTLLTQYSQDARKAGGLLAKDRVLGQVIRQIEQRMDKPLERQYEVAIERLFKQISDEKGGAKFVDRLESFADLNIDWENTPMKDIRTLVEVAADTKPELGIFVNPDLDGKALLSLAVAFAKTNSNVMDLLQLKRLKNQKEQTHINNLLKVAMGSGDKAMLDARNLIRKLPTLAILADRLLAKLNDVKGQHREILDRMARNRAFVDFHDSTLPVLHTEMAKLEATISAANEAWEATHLSEYTVPPGVNSTIEQVEANRKVLDLGPNGTTRADVDAHLRTMEQWMDAQPLDQHGSTWNTQKLMHDKLAMVNTRLGLDVIHKSMWNKLLGSITEKMDFLGIPAGKLAANRWRRFSALLNFRENGAILAVKASKAEGLAQKNLGEKHLTREEFLDRWYHPGQKYIEDRQDILAANKDTKVADQQVLDALRTHFLRDPSRRDALNRPGAWEALKGYFLASANAGAFEDKLRASPDFGYKLLDQGEGYRLFRETIGSPLFHRSRNRRDRVALLFDQMRPLWGGTANPKLTAEAAADAYRSDPNALRAAVAKLSVGRIWNEFVGPFSRRTKQREFYAPVRPDGVSPMAMPERIEKAFKAATPGDLIGLAENLYSLENGRTDIADFVGKTLETFQGLYDAMASDYVEDAQSNSSIMPRPKGVLSDARKAEFYPHEFLEYQAYNQQSMRYIIQHMAYEAAFGRDMNGLLGNYESARGQLKQQARDYDDLVRTVKAATIGRSHRDFRKALNSEAEKMGGKGYLTVLENATRHLTTLEEAINWSHAYWRANTGVPMELRWYVEAVSAMVAMTVQGPGSALVDTATSIIQPFRKLGISTEAFKNIGSKIGFAVPDAFNGLYQMFGKNFVFSAASQKRLSELNIGLSDSVLTMKDKMAAAWREPVNQVSRNHALAALEIGLVQTSRTIRQAISNGIGRASPDSLFRSPTVKPLAAFTWENELVHRAEMHSWWSRFEDLVRRGREYFRANPLAAADPKFRFSPRDLNYKKYLFGLINNERAFEYLNHAMGNYGIELEQAARDALARGPSGPLLVPEQYRQLASIVQQEMTLESDVTNRFPAMLTNPVLHLASPLIGWSISAGHSFIRGFREPNGEKSWAALKAGMLAYLAIVPVGIAYAMMRNEWDEIVIGKKANVAGFGQGNDFNALVDQMARASVFGVFGDIATSVLNQDTARPFSLDNRVFFVSTTLNALKALGQWGRQGEATWATVGRPLTQAMGGSGYLQYVDALNHIVGADNAESRIIARINVNNYLRAAGKELGLDVRSGAGFGALATRTRPWVSQMLLAAYADDALGFAEAREKAIEVAREEGKPDPEDFVKRSFQASHPLASVFRTKPSEEEYKGILSVLDARGQQNVSDAVALFNRYGATLGIRPSEGRAERRPRQVNPFASPFLSISDIRSRAVSDLQRGSLFATP